MCVGCGARARGGAASRRTCAARLRPHRRLSLFPLNNIVFAPPQKHLMRLARIKRAYYLRTRAAHVRRHARRRAMRGWCRIALEHCCGCVTCLSFPLEQHRFCALAKTLDASCAHQEGVLPTNARGTRPSRRRGRVSGGGSAHGRCCPFWYELIVKIPLKALEILTIMCIIQSALYPG